MKLDLKKAYDTLSWDFVKSMLEGLNFPAEFINWIMVCISMAKFSLLLNGSPVGFFSSKKGVRQGDPISPYIFVLAIEYLSRLLNSLKDNPEFKYHSKCKSQQLNHLVFVDDIMGFCKADMKSPILMKQAFEEFLEVSGLKPSIEKSQMFFGGS